MSESDTNALADGLLKASDERVFFGASRANSGHKRWTVVLRFDCARDCARTPAHILLIRPMPTQHRGHGIPRDN